MCMGSVVIQNKVDFAATRNVAVDSIQKPDELLVPMPREALANYGSVKYIQGCKQCGCSIALVVVCLAFRNARPQGQNGLRPVQGLDLAFLVHAQNQSLLRRV